MIATIMVTAIVTGTIISILMYRAKTKTIVNLDWKPSLSRLDLSKNCRIYLKHMGWDFIPGEDFIRFRIKSESIYIGIMTSGLLQRSTASESEYIGALGRELRIATSTWCWRVVCVVNFPVSTFGHDAALKEGFIILHYSSLDVLNRFQKRDDITLSNMDRIAEYILSGSRPICRAYAKESLEKNDLVGATKWATYAVRHVNQSGDDYMMLSKLYLAQSLLDKARTAAAQAVNLDRTNKAYLACLAESDAAIRAAATP